MKMDIIEQFKAARRVSTPLVCIRTFDPKSTQLNVTRSLNGKADTTPLLYWDAISGLINVNETEASTEAHELVLQRGELSQEGSRNLSPTLAGLSLSGAGSKSKISDAIVFVANAHLQWQTGDPNILQGIWNLRDTFKRLGAVLVLLTTPGASLPAELTNDTLLLDEPLPTADSLGSKVESLFHAAGADASLTPEVKARAVEALIGVPAFAAEQDAAMSLGIVKGEKGKPNTATLDIKQMWMRKRQRINNSPGLSVYDGKETLDDVGGVQAVKDFLSSVMTGRRAPSVIIWYDEIEKGFAGHGTDLSGTKTEMLGSQLTWHQEKGIIGVLHLGIPGVSKSLIPKALGNTFGRPVIGFDIAGMQAGHVGESNANLRTSQKTVEAVAGGGDILAIATCNSVSQLPAELLRRFDLATFFFDQPTKEERDLIWTIHRTRTGLVNAEPNPDSEGWTGDEIRSCCDKAWMLNWTLEKAAGFVVPVTVSDPERIKRIRNEANNRYLSASKGSVYKIGEATTKPRSSVTGPSFNEPERLFRA
jgi:hypothetical protein